MICERDILDNDVYLLSEELRDYIENKKENNQKIMFLCIGTDRCIGDALGPITGTILEKKGYNVLRTISKPVHAQNIDGVIEKIKVSDDFVIAIDASVTSSSDRVGQIIVQDSQLSPGLGVGKNLPKVGDISIIGNIATEIEGFKHLTYEILSNTRLAHIYTMANVIANIVELAIETSLMKIGEEVAIC